MTEEILEEQPKKRGRKAKPSPVDTVATDDKSVDTVATDDVVVAEVQEETQQLADDVKVDSVPILTPEQELVTLFATPHQFVAEVMRQQHTINPDATYDAPRYLTEEIAELTGNIGTEHPHNRALLLDDIVDCLWTAIAIKPTPPSYAEIDRLLNLPTLDSHTELGIFSNLISRRTRQTIMAHGSIDSPLLEGVALNLIVEIVRYAKFYNIDFVAGFKALCEENMSKLDAPEDKWSEVYRDGKCNKRDPQGNLYPWYKPANFAELV